MTALCSNDIMQVH